VVGIVGHLTGGVVSRKPVLPPTYLWASILIMIALHFAIPGPRIVRFPWSLFGIVPFVIGGALNLIADQAFKRHQTTVKPFEESSVLITTGVFRLSRNPMYVGFVLIVLGIALFMGTLMPYLVVVALPILLNALFIRSEEAMLERSFGEAWREYRRRVRRWI
jgi:protein-S-isoprenylcysteine O-methyltransferase Ste14